MVFGCQSLIMYCVGWQSVLCHRWKHPIYYVLAEIIEGSNMPNELLLFCDGDKVERLLPVHFAYVRLIFHSPFRLHFFLSTKYTTSDYCTAQRKNNQQFRGYIN